MRFDVITIFPEALTGLRVGLVGKALASGMIQLETHDLRKWAPPPHHKVDDVPFGGGPGMVMTPGPIVDAVRAVSRDGGRVIILSASGRSFDQAEARELSRTEQVVLVCGRFEGIDARVAEVLGAEELSIGDYVLNGGETAACVVIDAVARLVPGVLGNESSLHEESFGKGLLEYPQYTRPAEFEGSAVPDVLLSGDHARIAAWRRQQALRRTVQLRPELVEQADLTDEEREQAGRRPSEG